MRQGKFGDRVWCGLLIAGAGLLALGCEPDLGACDMTKLGGSDTQPHMGQVLVTARCAGGRCHSVDATGDLREGAPAELDFDVVPRDMSVEQISKVREGAENVHNNRHSMWGEIEGGSMPPAPPAGTGELSSEEKETIRNWLACGAEVIATPQKGMSMGADWTSIYETLVSATEGTLCVGCHSTTAGPNNGEGFVLGNPGDACAAYARVVNAAAVTPMCTGKGQLVVPSNPDASILLRKIQGGEQICGSPMPLGNNNGLGDHSVIADIRAWIMAGAPKPANCP